MVILPENKLIICTPPKCGTMTIYDSVPAQNRHPKFHVTVGELAEAGEIDPKQFFILTVIRNPWDRVISYYEFIKRSPSHGLHSRTVPMSFEEFVHSFAYTLAPCWKWIKESDQIIMFEDLKRSLEQVYTMFRVPYSPIGHHNRSTRHRDQYYTSTELIERVRGIFAKDIEIGAYEFPYGL